MRKLMISAVSLVLLLGLVVPASAQFGWLPKAGITPDSPFYFLDQWGEGMSMAFSFSNEAKANKALKFSEERLAEIQKMSEKGKTKQVEKATEKYQRHLERAEKKSEQVKEEKQEQIRARVASSTSKHLSVLEDVMNKVPEQAQQAIKQAKENSKKGHLQSLEALSKTNPQRAVGIGSKALEERIEQAKKGAQRNSSEQIEASLEDFEDFDKNLKEMTKGKTDLITLASKGRVDQIKLMEELEDFDELPTATKERLKQVQEETESDFRNSLSEVAQEKPEQAAGIHLQAVKNKVERIKKMAEQATDTPEMQREMEQEVNELRNQYNFGEEISEIAKQVGKGEVKVQKLVATATSRYLKVLEDVMNKVPGQAKQGVERAIEASQRGHQRAVEALEQAKKQGKQGASEALDKIKKAGPPSGTGPDSDQEDSTPTPSQQDQQMGPPSEGEAEQGAPVETPGSDQGEEDSGEEQQQGPSL